mmetsp:Transcript_12967/g.19758  ORF Transcript_12967/g.19758 Transcript_12967/m.19758 type:complete len:514 (-) Transcript_12967:134-1675(-)
MIRRVPSSFFIIELVLFLILHAPEVHSAMSSIAGQKLSTTLIQKCSSLNRACIAIAGGGGGAISTLAATPGASSVLLEGLVAYDRRSFVEFVGSSNLSDVPGICSREAAIALSNAALRRSFHLTPDIGERHKCIGVGCTSALVSTRPKKGDHRCHVALTTADGCSNIYSIVLDKEAKRSRSDEDEVVSNIVLLALLEESKRVEGNDDIKSEIDDVMSEVRNAILVDNETIVSENMPHRNMSSMEGAADNILNGNERTILLAPSPSPLDSSSQFLMPVSEAVLPVDPIIFPGSFNPPHVGHMQLARAAISVMKKKLLNESKCIENSSFNGGDESSPAIFFELSMTNPDKPPIPREDVIKRLNGFSSMENSILPENWGVLLTSAPLFAEKVPILSDFLPLERESSRGTYRKLTFVIGTDTMVRIIDPKYYDLSIPNMLKALESMKRKGVHFIVGGRVEQKKGVNDGSTAAFVDGLSELQSLPDDLQGMFTILSEDEFRVDISSSEIRAAAAKHSV